MSEEPIAGCSRQALEVDIDVLGKDIHWRQSQMWEP